ncbi:MAG: YggS family pyridoxal phosphate-dependent enzyme [Bacteroides sp.]|nr:YggS family pyridoxal phosphate-dependent enzyme [Bacteroides sp.]MCM1085306.1 YggS family pyridoxal phosphate-dependent enzyme [Bacteroides sp.]
MMLQENYRKVAATIKPGVRLVAVSKYKTVEEIKAVYDAGQRVFGENKAQEMRAKHEVLPSDIEWHFIGHLQRNKIKYIIGYVSLIHSIDSLELLEDVNKAAAKENRVVPCLLQFHIAEEETKFGLNLAESRALLESPQYKAMRNVRIDGVMGMATFTDSKEQVRREFASLRNIFQTLQAGYFAGEEHFREISMGMSDDYPVAMEEGSTLVRIGSSIFGARDYSLKLY